MKMFLSQTFENNRKMEHGCRLRRELKLDNRLESLHSHHLVAGLHNLSYSAGWTRTGPSLSRAL